VISCI